MKTIPLFALALVASAATIAPTVVEAAEPATATSIVHTADLDLSSESGQRALDLRIAVAAREVCGTASDVDLEGKNAARACRDEVVARAAGPRDQLLARKSGGTITLAAAR